MVEYAKSHLLDERLKAAIAELDQNAAEGREAVSCRVIGEEELDGRAARRAVGNRAGGERSEEERGARADRTGMGRGAPRVVAPRPTSAPGSGAQRV